MQHYLAVDLGATSGRTVLCSYDGGSVAMREFTRFENPQLPLGGYVYWDLPHLYNEILKALRQVSQEGVELTSIGIDTWGCDFAFFSKDGQPLGLPHCYRDPYTDGEMERFFSERMTQEELYQRTGIQFMPFNSIFQLSAQLRAGSVALAQADKVLFIPDALIHMLTGEAVCEYTVASTSQLLNPRTGDLDETLLKALGLGRERFGRLVMPGEQVGTLTPQVQAATGLGAVRVVAVGSHDTASAVAAVPAEDTDYAYLSCGTWSLLGIESPEPIITEASYQNNFTNEGGLEGTTRFLKNICGLWLFENCRREFRGVPEKIGPLTALCETSSFEGIILPDDPSFAHPESMCEAIRSFCLSSGQPSPQSPADFIRCIYRSLALRYRQVIELLEGMASFPIRRLHVIGGGSLNPHLMQMAADCTGLPVVAGPSEGTALGNTLVQIKAAGGVRTLPEMRSLVGRSVSLKTYEPHPSKAWEDTYDKFKSLK
ncbi:MAG: rhamnulokinase [Prevotellaceae bacterium]|nr:rhamnulokinase [Prevotellaceae bacterium]